MSCDCNEENLNPLASINWRASLVPAAAVIPAPIAYIKVVAVKKLVVEFLLELQSSASSGVYVFRFASFCERFLVLHCTVVELRYFTLRKLECFRQAFALNTLAWNNRIGL